MSARGEQTALASQLRSEGATWSKVVAAFKERWGLNARQALRVARGWSQQDVAAEWCRRWPEDPKSFKNVSTWERWPEGGHMPSLAVLDRLARIYHCSVSDLVSDFPDHGYVGDDDGVDRRSFIAGAGMSLAAAPLGSGSFSGDMADYWAAQLSSHWKTDRELGPHVLVGTVAAQCQALLHAVDVTDGTLHRRFLELATAFTGFAGWLTQDGGDMRACSRWLDDTLELAHRSGDPQLVSYALACKAMVRVDAGDGVGAVDLAEAALATAVEPTPKARIMAMQQAALGHALTGDRTQVDRLLDEIGQTLDELNGDSRPWGGDRLERSPEHLVGVNRATCYGYLGLSAEAADLWCRLETEEFDHEHRDLGVYLTRHAEVLLDVGEPREAARQARQAGRYLRQTGSWRMRREFTRMCDKAVPWTTTRAGRDLSDVLHEFATSP